MPPKKKPIKGRKPIKRKAIKKKPKQKGKGITSRVFQGVTNTYRKSAKALGNKRPIRILENGEFHYGLHNFTGPGTKINLDKVRNFKPYNNIDACSKVHDIEFNRAFKMPLGSKQRQKAIRDADEKAITCYKKYPNENGYLASVAGINSKMKVEDLSPKLFRMIMGEAYRGAKIKEPQTGGCMMCARKNYHR